MRQARDHLVITAAVFALLRLHESDFLGAIQVIATAAITAIVIELTHAACGWVTHRCLAPGASSESDG